MELKELEVLKSAVKEVIEDVLDTKVQEIKGELSGNSNAMILLNAELHHIKEQVNINTKNLNDIICETRDIKNITIGTDGQNGLRGRIISIEKKNESQDQEDNCIKKEVDTLKNFKQQLIGLSIGISITASTLGSIIAYLISNGVVK